MYQDILVRHYILLRRGSSPNGWRAVIWVILQWALPLFHNDNNYPVKNSCAVFSSSSFSLILCRINVFLLLLTRDVSPAPLMRLISVCLQSFTAIFHPPTLIRFIHKATGTKASIHQTFGRNPFLSTLVAAQECMQALGSQTFSLTPVVFPVCWLAIQRFLQACRKSDPESPARHKNG